MTAGELIKCEIIVFTMWGVICAIAYLSEKFGEQPKGLNEHFLDVIAEMEQERESLKKDNKK